MDRYSMHHMSVRAFMPNKKRNKQRRDKECMKQYDARLVFPYETLGIYKQ